MNIYSIHIPRDYGNGGNDFNNNIKLLDNLFAEVCRVLGKNNIFSLEIFCSKQVINFTFACEEEIANILKGVIYSASSFAQIEEIKDYVERINEDEYEIATSDLVLTRNAVFPIKNYSEFSYECLTNVLNQCSSLSSDDNLLIQITCKPYFPSTLFLKTVKPKIRRDRMVRMFTTLKYWLNDKPYDDYLKRASEKCFELSNFLVNIRILTYISKNVAPKNILLRRLENNILKIADSYRSFNDNFNGFVLSPIKYNSNKLIKFFRRTVDKKALMLSSKELVSLWHLPSLKIAPSVPSVLSVKLAPPKDLPTNIDDPNVSYFATTDYRDIKINFGINREDRRRHLYLVGKSGNGKSSLMKLLAKSDIKHGVGICVLDPHGDLVDSLLSSIPKERIKDVIIFDPTESGYPLSFNPFSGISSSYRSQFVISFMEVFKKTFSLIWNDNYEFLLRYTLLTILSVKGESFLSIRKILTNKRYRLSIASKVSDMAIKSFWFSEYDEWVKRYGDDVVGPFLDKIDSFTTNECLKNIFIQRDNEFNFREIIDSNKILLLKLPKGILGDENVSLLGSMLVFKIYHAAMSRANIPESKRKDFYFYVDEFHSFMTESFKQILSESRKYKLNLTIANQYLGQLPKDIQDTIFGNIANIMVFGTGGNDAERLASELSQNVSKEDIMSLPPRHIYVKMSINGDVQAPFSAITLNVQNASSEDYTEECINYSRQHYSICKNGVEESFEYDDIENSYDDNYEINSDEDYTNNYIDNYCVNYSDNYNDDEDAYDDPISMHNLNIQDNPVSDNLRQYLRCYGTVLLLSYLDISDDMLKSLSDEAFSRVEELDLKGTNIGDKGLESISCLSELVELNLDGTNITSNAMKYIRDIRRLDLLSLNSTRVDDDAIKYLASTSIMNLCLRNTCITNNSIEYFREINDLEELDIRGTLIDENGAKKLRELMPDLILIF